MKQLWLLPLLLSLMPLHAQTYGVDSPTPVSLQTMKDEYRPVLIFSPSNDQLLHTQMRLFAKGVFAFHERQVILVPLILHDSNKPWAVVFSGESLGQMSPSDQQTARTRFHIAPNAFTVILLGKDGEEKLRSTKPVTIDQIKSLIDTMPMRQQEMKEPHRR